MCYARENNPRPPRDVRCTVRVGVALSGQILWVSAGARSCDGAARVGLEAMSDVDVRCCASAARTPLVGLRGTALCTLADAVHTAGNLISRIEDTDAHGLTEKS